MTEPTLCSKCGKSVSQCHCLIPGTQPTLSQDIEKQKQNAAAERLYQQSVHEGLALQIAALDGYIKSDKLTVQHLAERVAQLERRLAGPLEGPGFGQLEKRMDHLEEALASLHDIDDQPIFEPRGPHD